MTIQQQVKLVEHEIETCQRKFDMYTKEVNTETSIMHIEHYVKSSEFYHKERLVWVAVLESIAECAEMEACAVEAEEFYEPKKVPGAKEDPVGL